MVYAIAFNTATYLYEIWIEGIKCAMSHPDLNALLELWEIVI